MQSRRAERATGRIAHDRWRCSCNNKSWACVHRNKSSHAFPHSHVHSAPCRDQKQKKGKMTACAHRAACTRLTERVLPPFAHAASFWFGASVAHHASEHWKEQHRSSFGIVLARRTDHRRVSCDGSDCVCHACPPFSSLARGRLPLTGRAYRPPTCWPPCHQTRRDASSSGRPSPADGMQARNGKEHE